MMERSIDVKTRHYPQGNNNTKGIYKKKEEEAQLTDNSYIITSSFSILILIEKKT